MGTSPSDTPHAGRDQETRIQVLGELVLLSPLFPDRAAEGHRNRHGFDGLLELALLGGKTLRIRLEAHPTTVRAEVEPFASLHSRGRCVGHLDLHTAHRVEGVAVIAP